MLLAAGGLLYGERQLARQAKASGREGTRHRHMISVARAAGFWVYNNVDSTLAEVKWFINHELPVIVNFFEPSDDVAHYADIHGPLAQLGGEEKAVVNGGGSKRL